MNVLALNGSPKREGKVATLSGQILEGARTVGHRTEMIHLVDLSIADCTGCLVCQKTGGCVIRDDIGVVEEVISRADVIVWATPTHWGNMSGLMLRTVERLFGFFIEEQQRGMPLKRNAKGKGAILVTACSTPRPFHWIFNQSRATLGRLREVCRYSGQRILATVVLPGTLRMKGVPDGRLDRAKRVGKELA